MNEDRDITLPSSNRVLGLSVGNNCCLGTSCCEHRLIASVRAASPRSSFESDRFRKPLSSETAQHTTHSPPFSDPKHQCKPPRPHHRFSAAPPTPTTWPFPDQASGYACPALATLASISFSPPAMAMERRT
ncbi:hypothetical protein K458DRAFT_124534 [Lentithecium fluviatile CBS 122367]|uniref:Uncharacterized protein n=1 Tax=Lentithecium fluviatile CBS 122367 TaxID=1168545 RepID=A0A6G1JG88_9PLEO|nr:hypothetical protein K458DRAFT_124534 [Lentithecium fluviatile CBS 122367]